MSKSNIIIFPKRGGRVTSSASVCVPVRSANAVKTVFTGMVWFVWVATALVWPVLKRVLSIEVFFQFIRMIYYWDARGVHASWTFLLHFTALVAITWFVTVYKPKLHTISRSVN